MQLLRQLVFRLRPKQPYSLTLDVIERQIDREVTEVSAAAQEARAIESGFARIRTRLATALRDHRSPGVVDADEARDIARELLDSSAHANTHTKRLEGLVS